MIFRESQYFADRFPSPPTGKGRAFLLLIRLMGLIVVGAAAVCPGLCDAQTRGGSETVAPGRESVDASHRKTAPTPATPPAPTPANPLTNPDIADSITRYLTDEAKRPTISSVTDPATPEQVANDNNPLRARGDVPPAKIARPYPAVGREAEAPVDAPARSPEASSPAEAASKKKASSEKAEENRGKTDTRPEKTKEKSTTKKASDREKSPKTPSAPPSGRYAPPQAFGGMVPDARGGTASPPFFTPPSFSAQSPSWTQPPVWPTTPQWGLASPEGYGYPGQANGMVPSIGWSHPSAMPSPPAGSGMVANPFIPGGAAYANAGYAAPNPYSAGGGYGHPYGPTMGDPYGAYGPAMVDSYAAHGIPPPWQVEPWQGPDFTPEEETPSKPFFLRKWMPVEISFPILETSLESLAMFNPFDIPEGPHRGIGQPLLMRSWMDRPFYIGGFGGMMVGGSLIEDWLIQRPGGTGGFIFGWNYDHYWGVESRFSITSMTAHHSGRARIAYQDWAEAQAAAGGGGGGDETFIAPVHDSTNDLTLFDVSVHYYPLGNAKWRPFFKVGLGLAHQEFTDALGNDFQADSLAMPLGMGVKYWWSDWVALQLDCVDNIVFSASGAQTTHNFSVTGGFVFPFGRSPDYRRTVYWPHNPGQLHYLW